MWRLTSCSDSDGNPFLNTLNSHQGRQVWVFDAEAGTPEERAEVERLRAEFTKNRFVQKHSSDELLRLQRKPFLKVVISHWHELYFHFVI
jgi:hypothetical protein